LRPPEQRRVFLEPIFVFGIVSPQTPFCGEGSRPSAAARALGYTIFAVVEVANIAPVGVTVRCSGYATSSRNPATTPRTAQITGVEVVTGPLTEHQNAGVSCHIEIQIRPWIDQGPRPPDASRATWQRSTQTTTKLS
jgi:hypothetical protein